ncbi:hypothetical protein TWF506_011373 [Arthrobotrys conoides]|uniref:Uncharacterized protein n=1 Tax=Arthrobotrys conoides TaxID=74498 RepID=A0AAN8NAS0_9PEZI
MAPIPDTKAPKDEGANAVSSDNSTTETTLALVALVFAAVAFLAAFFQALLQYLTSNQRDKCLLGAIGTWSVYTKTRWDPWKWRIIVQYPRLRFDPGTILIAREKYSESLKNWQKTAIPDQRYGFCLAKSDKNIKNHNLFWYLEDRGKVIGDGERALTFWDLTITQKIYWLWFSLRKRRSGDLPFARAGWCNLLTAFVVLPDKGMISHYENADIIPSSIDVPIQRMKLFDLCLLCYIANIKDVKINLLESTINGQNRYIKLNTQETPGLGKFVTVDGDFEKLKKKLAIAHSLQLFDVCIMAQGAIMGPGFCPSLGYFDEGVFLFGLARRWEQQNWVQHMRDWKKAIYDSAPESIEREKTFNSVSLERQAERFSEYIQHNPGAKWEDTWS